MLFCILSISMKKVITTSILLLLFSPLYAHDSERIDQLEQRVLKLESLLNSSPAKAETITSSSEGWKSIAKKALGGAQ